MRRGEEEEEEEERVMGRPARGEAEMEPGIWGCLPEELLERVIALLPLPVIVSLRPTCKRFHSLLLSPSFLALLPTSPYPYPSSSTPFLLLSHPHLSARHLPAYDSSASCWRTLRLPPSPLLLCSSSSGLLCFSSSTPSHSLVVCNVLTGTSRTLRPPVKHVTAATLAPLASPFRAPSFAHGYKLFVPSSTGVFVYDSDKQSWTRFDAFDTARLAENCHQEGVLFDGSLYFTTPEPFQVVGFDVETGRWAPLAAEAPGEATFLRLVSSGEGLYLVGGVGRDGIARSLRVWELAGSDGDGDGDGPQKWWREVGRLPEMMCRKFWSVCYHNYAHLQCFWHGGMVCVGCTTWPEVLQYRVGRGTWHWLPRCPMLPERSSCGFRWFSFVPDLHALV